MSKTLLICMSALCALCACKKPSASANASGSNAVTSATTSEADQKAEAMLKEAYDFIKQEKADEAEAKLAQIIALKPKLSENVRAQVTPAIIGLGMVDPKRGVKLGQLWEK